MNLDPGGLIAWLVVGLIAGWLAGLFMKGGGYGVVGDIVLALSARSSAVLSSVSCCRVAAPG